MELLTKILCVALGSSLGGLARWGMSVGVARLLGTVFPWGTLFINVLGSFFLGWFATIMLGRLQIQQAGWLRPEHLYLLLAVGFTGAYTTFSTFEFEAHELMEKGEGLAGMFYLIGSVCLGLLAVRAGVLLARWQ